LRAIYNCKIKSKYKYKEAQCHIGTFQSYNRRNTAAEVSDHGPECVDTSWKIG
jgi:hypothetical protein